MSKSVTVQQRGLSITRLCVAILTLGLSVPFLGVRRRRRTVTRNHA
jgi:hypothetical protein